MPSKDRVMLRIQQAAARIDTIMDPPTPTTSTASSTHHRKNHRSGQKERDRLARKANSLQEPATSTDSLHSVSRDGKNKGHRAGVKYREGKARKAKQGEDMEVNEEKDGFSMTRGIVLEGLSDQDSETSDYGSEEVHEECLSENEAGEDASKSVEDQDMDAMLAAMEAMNSQISASDNPTAITHNISSTATEPLVATTTSDHSSSTPSQPLESHDLTIDTVNYTTTPVPQNDSPTLPAVTPLSGKSVVPRSPTTTKSPLPRTTSTQTLPTQNTSSPSSTSQKQEPSSQTTNKSAPRHEVRLLGLQRPKVISGPDLDFEKDLKYEARLLSLSRTVKLKGGVSS